MDRTQLVARLVAELATARAAITASYLRLWSPAEQALPDPDAANRPSGLTSDLETGEAPEQRMRRGCGSPTRRDDQKLE